VPKRGNGGGSPTRDLVDLELRAGAKTIREIHQSPANGGRANRDAIVQALRRGAKQGTYVQKDGRWSLAEEKPSAAATS
jgi:hypothetical protein